MSHKGHKGAQGVAGIPGYIEYLEIQNLYSHKKTRYDFCEGVNIITGAPLSGKSVASRALNILRTNRPLGFGYHSHFAKKGDSTKIILKIKNGSKITFCKSASDAYYQINDDKPLRKFGTGVPDKITNLLNMSEVNIQKQHDEPFLIMSSAGNVGKTINRITNLDQIELLSSDTKKIIGEQSTKVKLAESKIKEAKTELEKFEDFDKLEKTVTRLKKTVSSIEEKESTLTYLKETSAQIQALSQQILKIEKALEVENIVEKLEKNKTKIENNTKQFELIELFIVNSKKIDKLQVVFTSLRNVFTDIETIESEIAHNQDQQNLLKNFISLVDIEKFKKYYKKSKDCIEKIKNLLTEITSVSEKQTVLSKFVTNDKKIIKKEKQYNTALDNYLLAIEDEEVCPLCTTEIDNIKLKKIKKNLEM